MTDPLRHTCTRCHATFTYRPDGDDLKRCPYCDRLQDVMVAIPRGAGVVPSRVERPPANLNSPKPSNRPDLPPTLAQDAPKPVSRPETQVPRCIACKRPIGANWFYGPSEKLIDCPSCGYRQFWRWCQPESYKGAL